MFDLPRIFVVCATAFLITYFLFLASPFPYPRHELVSVPLGATLRGAAQALQDAGAVRSVTAFIIVSRLFEGNDGIRAGSYLLSYPENVFSLSHRLAHGISNLTHVKVTVPEGLSVREIGDLLAKNIPGFDGEAFKMLAQQDEGYLFPDTYFFLPGDTPETVIQNMRNTFDLKTASLEAEIIASGKSKTDIITMASILEEEARQTDTRKIVSGILWKRIAHRIPLQVDAVFGYILGKSGYAPTAADLKIDSPYNTYTHRNLPPGPISNPGLDALEAALRPTATPYLYYLTGSDGVMYYARTFEEHIANQKHLK